MKGSTLPTYRTTLRLPVSNLFEVFSIDFGGPYQETENGNRFVLIAVEHLTNWPIAVPCKDSTAATVIKVIKEHIILPFCPPTKIISDNATCFSAKSLLKFMDEHGTQWKTVMAYAPVSNGKAERMVGTMKRSITKTVLQSKQEWDQVIDQVVYGYRRRRNSNGFSPYQLMYGHPPRITSTDSTSLVTNSGSDDEVVRNLELLATENLRTEQFIIKNKPKLQNSKITKFSIGDKVLVAHGNATKKNVG